LSPILGIIASQNYPRITNSYESIATANGTGSSGVITFSSIPSTYKHLQIRYIARDTQTATFVTAPTVSFNGDTANNYTTHYLYGNGTVVTAGANVGTNEFGYILATGANAGTNTYAAGIIDILDYTSTSKTKTVRTMSAADNNGSGEIYFNSGLWFATPAAITSITFNASTNYTSLTTFALYGIRG
jgi:hypothetical protein